MDSSTSARLLGVQTDGDMHRLLDPIEADGVFQSRMIGQLRLYSFPDEIWAEAAAKLAKAILAAVPAAESRVNAARAMFTSGGSRTESTYGDLAHRDLIWRAVRKPAPANE